MLVNLFPCLLPGLEIIREKNQNKITFCNPTLSSCAYLIKYCSPMQVSQQTGLYMIVHLVAMMAISIPGFAASAQEQIICHILPQFL